MIHEDNPSLRESSKYMKEVIEDAGVKTGFSVGAIEFIASLIIVGALAFFCGVDIGTDRAYDRLGVKHE